MSDTENVTMDSNEALESGDSPPPDAGDDKDKIGYRFSRPRRGTRRTTTYSPPLTSRKVQIRKLSTKDATLAQLLLRFDKLDQNKAKVHQSQMTQIQKTNDGIQKA